MHETLETEIVIHAAPEQVWDALLDFPAHADWNPFIAGIAGTPELGETLDVTLTPPDGRPFRFRPTVVAAEPNRVFAWRGKFVVRGLFDGEHRFELEPVEGGTRLRHSERFRGVLVPLLRKMIHGPTRAGFEAMNRALADRVSGARLL